MTLRMLCSLVLLTVLSSARASAADAPMTLQLAYVDVDSAPFQLGRGPEVADPPGISVEMVQRAVSDAGLKLQLQRLPQLRMLHLLETGKIDGAFIFSYNEDRAKRFAYPMLGDKPNASLRATHIRYRLYRRVGSPVNWDGRQFEQLDGPIGANKGWVIVSTLRDMGLAVDDGAPDHPGNFAKLRLGRVAAMAALEPSADSYLQIEGITDVEKVGPPLTSRDYFLLFSRAFVASHPELAERIWQKLALIREQSETALYRKYQTTLPPRTGSPVPEKKP